MTKKLERLLLTTLEDPYDKNSWSGIPYSLRLALEKRIPHVSVLSRLKPRRNPKDVVLRIALGGVPPRYPLWMTRSALNGFAQEVSAAIHRMRPDAVLSISSQCLIGLRNPGVPLFMFTDAPWMAWKQAYSRFEATPLPGPRFARMEGQAARNWTGVALGSEWAVREARKLYSIPPERIHTVRLGANWMPDLSKIELMERIGARSHDRLDLLYVGKDWERKGGPLAVEVARVLYRRGVNVQLHIVGCRPRLIDAGAFVTIHGLLRLDQEADRAKMVDLFLNSHFLLVPTFAECFGIVFAEAQAFGLPPVSQSVHALPSVVVDGKTGILLPEEAGAAAYADRISSAFENRTAYETLARRARDHYEAALNWDRCAELLTEMIESNLEKSAVQELAS